MGRINRLSAVQVVRFNKPGRYADGGGLILQCVSGSAGALRKSWLFRFERGGRERMMGLGALADVSLAQARAQAADARSLLRQGVDPLPHRDAQRAAQALQAAKGVTFKKAAADYIAQHEAGWRNAVHRHQWITTLRQYAEPVLGDIAVAAIDTDLVLRVLRPIWITKSATAARLRARIEAVLNFAMTDGDRANPARWRGHLEFKLDRRIRKVRGVKHLAAMPHAEVPKFMEKLREREGVAYRALEFAILTAARRGEVISARWDEIDLAGETWVIPKERMKGGREHRVPLSKAAMAILAALPRESGNNHIFVGTRRQKMGDEALLDALRSMGCEGATVHGFRSSFRDWAAEETPFARETVEAALAHVVGDRTERAYLRSDALEKRRRLMADWGEHCAKATVTGQVVPLRKRRR